LRPARNLLANAEVNDVAILDDVVLAFDAHQAGFLGGFLSAVAVDIFELGDFGTDEGFFEVGVDDAGSLGGAPAAFDGPGADFDFTSGGIGDQTEGLEGFLDQAVEAGFTQTEVGEEGLGFFIAELGDFVLNLGADANHGGALFGGMGVNDLGEVVVHLRQILLADVTGVDHRFAGDEHVGFEQGEIVSMELDRTDGLTFAEDGADLVEDFEDLDGVFVASADALAEAVAVALDLVEVGKGELEVDGFHVGERIDLAVDVNDVVVFEAADDVDDGVGVLDVLQELVAATFTFRGAADEAGDVDEFHGGELGGLGLNDLNQAFDAVVGDQDGAFVRLDGAEGVVGGFGTGLGDGVEEGGFADVGKADDTCSETSHDKTPDVFVTPPKMPGLGNIAIALAASCRKLIEMRKFHLNGPDSLRASPPRVYTSQ
jgi:hypothetical protein